MKSDMSTVQTECAGIFDAEVSAGIHFRRACLSDRAVKARYWQTVEIKLQIILC